MERAAGAQQGVQDGGDLRLTIMKKEHIIALCRKRLQLIRKAPCAKQHIPCPALSLFPGHIPCLFFQFPQDIGSHRFLPVSALAQNQIFLLRIHCRNIDFGPCVPIATQLCKVERPCIRRVQLPHPFAAHVLIDKGDMVAGQAFPYLFSIIQESLSAIIFYTEMNIITDKRILMECIEILFVAYYSSMKDTRHANDAYDTFCFIQGCADSFD